MSSFPGLCELQSKSCICIHIKKIEESQLNLVSFTNVLMGCAKAEHCGRYSRDTVGVSDGIYF